jgi:alkylhydroperoxidase family enzyme
VDVIADPGRLRQLDLGVLRDWRSTAHRICEAEKHLRKCIEEQRAIMARVEGIDPKKTSFLMRQVFKKVRKMVGRDLTGMKILARVPRLFWFSILGTWLLDEKAKAAPRLRALVVLRTAVRVGCPFWIDANSAGGRMYGLSDEEIAAIRESKYEGFSPSEAALLRLADALADTPSNVSDELYAELNKYFSVEELMEIAANAAFENYRARSNRLLDVGSDGLYRKGLRFKQRGAE